MIRKLLVTLAFMATAMATANAQATEQYTFYMLLGKDTIAAEPVTRTPTSLAIDLYNNLQHNRWRIALTRDAKGATTGLRTAFFSAASDTAPLQSAVFAPSGDSVIVTITGNVSRTDRLKSEAGAIPYVNPSSALSEEIVMRAKALGGASARVPVITVQGGQTVWSDVRWIGSDSATVSLGNAILRLKIDAQGHILGGGVKEQNVSITRVEGVKTIAIAKPDYGAPAGAPYSAEEVRVKTPQGLTLTGTLTLPTTRPSGGVPAMVTITGSGAEDRDESIPIVAGYRPFRQIADTLARRGIAVLRLDDRGINGSDAGPAGPTSADFANDIRAGLAYLRTRPEIDRTRLGLIGHSEGGMIAPMIAASEPTLRGIVVMAGPAYTGAKIIEYQQRFAIEHSPAVKPEQRDSLMKESRMQLDSLAAKTPWMRYFLDYDPIPTAKKVKVPVLIMQGATDRQVTPDQAPVLAAALKSGGNRDVTVRVFPATNHLFLPDSSGDPGKYTELTVHDIPPATLGVLADWVVARMK